MSCVAPVSLEVRLRGEVPLTPRGGRQLHPEYFGRPDGKCRPAGTRRASEWFSVECQHDVGVDAQLSWGFRQVVPVNDFHLSVVVDPS